MRKSIAIFLSIFCCLPLAAQLTPTAVTLTPYGAAVIVGDTQQFTAVCSYSSHADDDCTAAGGVTWGSLAPSQGSITSGGLATMLLAADPGAGFYNAAAFTATANGVVVEAMVYGQHPGDQWRTYVTPLPLICDQINQATCGPASVAVGATIALGYGFTNVNGGDGNPIIPSCTWSSSNSGIASVNSLGQVTAVAPGSVTITCNRNGDADYTTTSTEPGWVTPGNTIAFNVVNGGTGTQNWYVMRGGGTPFTNSTDTPFGQCDGKHIATYASVAGGAFSTTTWTDNTVYPPGANVVAMNPNGHWYVTTAGGTSGSALPTWNTSGGTNTDGTITDWQDMGTYPVQQACALGQFRDLFMDLNFYQQVKWMMAGGDTVTVDQFDNGNLAAGPDDDFVVTPINCHGNSSGCYMSSIPSGSSGHHTIIQGVNHAACTSKSAKSQLYGQYGAYSVINATESQFVDFSCIDITDHTQYVNNNNWANNCPGPSTGADCGVQQGIIQSAFEASVTYTDDIIHGMLFGVFGTTGVGVVMNRVAISGNYGAGLSLDVTPFQATNIDTSGGLLMTNSFVGFNGCDEQYPITLNYPYVECRDKNNGGYGDGLGTGSTTGNWEFDGDLWLANVQDNLDLLHSGLHSLIVKNNWSEAAVGQSYKFGSANNVVFQNSTTVGDCDYVGSYVFGDEPTSSLGFVSHCRANSTNMLLAIKPFSIDSILGNSFISDALIALEVELPEVNTTPPLTHVSGYDSATTANTTLQNNIFAGWSNTALGAGLFNPLFSNQPSLNPSPNGFATESDNIFYNVKSGNCPTLGSNETCNTISPQWVGQPAGSSVPDPTYFDNWNFMPSLNLPGTFVAALSADLIGAPRPTTPTAPSMGAVQYDASPTPITVTLNSSMSSIAPSTNIILTATFSSTPSYGVMTFTDTTTSTVLGTYYINPAWSDVQFFTPNLTSAGAHSITANYRALSNVGSSTSSPVTVTVTGASVGFAHSQGRVQRRGNSIRK